MDEEGRPAETRFEVSVTDEQTVIDVIGSRDAAIVVQSASGERIYLPPPNFDEPPADDRRTPYESPYSGSAAATPYASAYSSPATESRTPGVSATADGFRVVHPESASDVRVLRGDQSPSTSR